MSVNRGMIVSWCAAVIVSSMLVGCSPQAPSDKSGSGSDAGKEPVVSVAFSMSADCVACHAEEQASTENGACLASKHVGEATCTTCHADESALTKVHEGATSDAKKPKRLKKTDVKSEICQSCHSDDARTAATAAITVCTDSEGTTVNPHDLPSNDDHASIECINCHEEHTEKDALELAPEECLSCHHADVYECNTCHD